MYLIYLKNDLKYSKVIVSNGKPVERNAEL